ncbi:MAG: helix-turn-helix domain-containing protein [Leptospirillum sp.]
MSVQAIDWALRLVKNVTPTQKLILICLANHAGPDGTCWPSQTIVSDYSRLSRDAVNKNIKELESLGLIASKRRKDSDGRETTKTYRLKMAEPLGVVLDYTGVVEMGGRCSPGLHPIKSRTNKEQKDMSPEITACSPELYRGIAERHTGVIQNYTDCSPGLHKSFKKEPSKEETKDLKTPPTPKSRTSTDPTSGHTQERGEKNPTSAIRDNPKAAEHKTVQGDGSPSRQNTHPDKILLPDWLRPEDWNDYREHRVSIKCPLTSLAEKKALSELENLRNQGNDPGRVISQSIVNGWKGLFPVKSPIVSQGGRQRPQTFDEIHREKNKQAIDAFIASHSSGEEEPHVVDIP